MMAAITNAEPFGSIPDELWLQIFSKLDPWQQRASALHKHLHMGGFNREKPLELWGFWIAHEDELKVNTRSLILKLSCVCKRWRDVLATSPLARAIPWPALHSIDPDKTGDDYYRFMSTSRLAGTNTLYLLNRQLSRNTIDHLASTLGGQDSSVRALFLKACGDPSGHHAVVTLAAAFPDLQHLILDMGTAAAVAACSGSSPDAGASSSVTFCSTSLSAAARSLKQLQSLRIYAEARTTCNVSSGLVDLLARNPQLELLHVEAFPLDNMPDVAATLAHSCKQLRSLHISMDACCYIQEAVGQLVAALPQLKSATFLVHGASAAGLNVAHEQQALKSKSQTDVNITLRFKH